MGFPSHDVSRKFRHYGTTGLLLLDHDESLLGLVILDKVTRGTEQETANYGLHATLQAKRAEINHEIERVKNASSTYEGGDVS